jgi:hypothetical protein
LPQYTISVSRKQGFFAFLNVSGVPALSQEAPVKASHLASSMVLAAAAGLFMSFAALPAEARRMSGFC